MKTLENALLSTDRLLLRKKGWIEQYENGTYFQGGIELKETQELIGIIAQSTGRNGH